MKELELLLSVAAAAVGLLITTVTFIAKFIKSAKAKKAAENIVKIGAAILPYIEQAEKYINYSGEEKKEFVMTNANRFAIKNNIKFDANLVSEKVEELVKLTKEVNSGNKAQALTAKNKSDEMSALRATLENQIYKK